jgi:phospholipase/carboxylesterase
MSTRVIGDLLKHVGRPATGEAQGLLVLHHGRGTDENDLLGLADVLDPEGRLHVVSVRGPLQLAGSPGYHWYLVPRVGYPDPDTFFAARQALAELHDHLFAQTGVAAERTVLGGFSMGCVMSYALGLDSERPAPAGILAMSGFVPTVEGWAPALHDSGRAAATRVLILHGHSDPVIRIEFARTARDALSGAGFAVEYHESNAAHHLEPEGVRAAESWLRGVLADA